jgi:hypothetical protein
MKAGGSNPFAIRTRTIPSYVVTVKGIPVFRMVVSFAGHYRNEDLGRSVSHAAVSPVASRRAGDSGCPKGAEEGNVVGMRHKQSVCTQHMHE